MTSPFSPEQTAQANIMAKKLFVAFSGLTKDEAVGLTIGILASINSIDMLIHYGDGLKHIESGARKIREA